MLTVTTHDFIVYPIGGAQIRVFFVYYYTVGVTVLVVIDVC